MRITKKEVKTIYDIEVSFRDYCDIRAKARTDDTAKIMEAFKFADLNDEKLGTLRREFKNLQFRRDAAETLKYIVKELGFDGVVNFGYHKEKAEGHDVHVMVVFNYGDDLN